MRLEEVQVNLCLTWKDCLGLWMELHRAGAGESARGWDGLGRKGRVDQGVTEGTVSAECREGRGWEDMASGGVPL